MSDFDDFFARKLEEEASFPNKGKQWKQMSKRLDAFDAGGLQGNLSKLRWWQAAAVVAMLTTGFLIWKSNQNHQQTKALHQEIATLQLERKQLAEQLTVAETSAATPIKNSTKSTVNDSKNTPEIIESQVVAQANGLQHTINTPAPKLSPEEQTVEANIAAQREQAAPLPSGLIDSLQNRIAVLEATLLAQEQLKETTAKPLESPEKAQETPAIASAASKAEAEIKPVKVRKNRFKIGIQGSLGFAQPKQPGVSSLKGQGFTFEAKVYKNLWLTSSFDWLQHEVNTKEFVPKFHPHHDSLPKPPDNNGGGGGWPHPDKLVQVESAPKQQQFGLGLRYEIPVKCWVRPSVRLAHVWSHLPPSTITYKYEEDDPGGPGPGPGPHNHRPEYAIEKFDNQWISNQWRLGVGIEKDIPGWTFGLWADYSKNLSASTPAFDALYLRAGAQYRF